MDSSKQLLSKSQILKTHVHFLEAVVDDKTDEVSELIESGLDPATIKDQYGYTALMLAVCAGNARTAKLLIEHHIKNNQNALNAKNNEGYTALMLAASIGSTQIIGLLVPHLDSSAIKTEKNRLAGGKENALKIAIEHGQMDAVLALVPYFDKLNEYGVTPIMYAAYFGQTDICLKLMPLFDTSTINAVAIGYSCHTVLTIALERGYPKTALALIPFLDTITLELAKSNNQSPYKLAKEKGYNEVLNVLNTRLRRDKNASTTSFIPAVTFHPFNTTVQKNPRTQELEGGPSKKSRFG